MSQTKAQLVQPVGIFTAPGVNVSGVLTASSFSGNLTGTVTGLTTTANITVGVLTATKFFGSGANLTGVAGAAYVGQSTTSQSPITTINLSLGNVIYFTHNTDTTVAFANTSTTQELRFIRVKDDTLTPRTITWPSNIIWDGASPPTLGISSSPTDAQIFNLTTRDGGVTWYGDQEFSNQPGTGIFAFGRNIRGNLGQNNNITYYSSPVQIPGTTWSSISAGNLYSLATKTDGTLWSWGVNNSGQLGQNNTTYYSSPVQIPGTTWRYIGIGGDIVLSIKTDGTLWAWGNNSNGELGQNNRTQYSSPIQIPGTTWKFLGGSNNKTSIFATKTDGTLWAWGYNFSGQLGQNNRIFYSSPVQIPGTTWNFIEGSLSHALATKTDGTLWSWGYGGSGQLGLNNITPRSSPVQIPGTTWNTISFGSIHSSATKTDGTIWIWGSNNYGQLGQNNRTQYSSPVQIPGTTWSSISSGSNHLLATKTDGTLWGWGRNYSGQLGQNNQTDRSSPVQIPGTTWSSISGGVDHSLVIRQVY